MIAALERGKSPHSWILHSATNYISSCLFAIAVCQILGNWGWGERPCLCLPCRPWGGKVNCVQFCIRSLSVSSQSDSTQSGIGAIEDTSLAKSTTCLLTLHSPFLFSFYHNCLCLHLISNSNTSTSYPRSSFVISSFMYLPA